MTDATGIVAVVILVTLGIAVIVLCVLLVVPCPKKSTDPMIEKKIGSIYLTFNNPPDPTALCNTIGNAISEVDYLESFGYGVRYGDSVYYSGRLECEDCNIVTVSDVAGKKVVIRVTLPSMPIRSSDTALRMIGAIRNSWNKEHPNQFLVKVSV